HDQYRGLFDDHDVLRELIREYRVEARGSPFQATEEFESRKGDDPQHRPCRRVVGPDGAMYVCDWRTDSGGAGRLWGDGKHGRIYRIRWDGNDAYPAIPLRGLDSWSKHGKQSDEELFKSLESHNFSDRLRAQQEIVRRGDKHAQPLHDLLKDKDKPVRARIAALGALQSFRDFDPGPFISRLTDPAPDIRRLSAD